MPIRNSLNARSRVGMLRLECIVAITAGALAANTGYIEMMSGYQQTRNSCITTWTELDNARALFAIDQHELG